MKTTKPSPVPTRQAAFLAAFAILGRVFQAAAAAGISRQSHYRWLKDSPSYPALFARAKAQAIDTLEDEAIARAVDGVFVPNTYKGELVYPSKTVKTPALTKTGKHKVYNGKPVYVETVVTGKEPLGVMRKSDPLLEMLLKAYKPEMYGDRSQNRNGRKEDLQVPRIDGSLLTTYRELCVKDATADD